VLVVPGVLLLSACSFAPLQYRIQRVSRSRGACSFGILTSNDRWYYVISFDVASDRDATIRIVVLLNGVAKTPSPRRPADGPRRTWHRQ